MWGRLLILGASGQVAREIPGSAAAHGFSEIVSIGRSTADLSTADAEVILREQAPDAVINAAAYTAVDLAESEPAAALALNADMPGRFAAAAADRGIPFVHISTDYVFDGRKTSAYVETDPRRPINVYGRTKAAGEDAVIEAGGDSVILRTSWIYGPHGRNFWRTMRNLAKTREELNVVCDQIGCPTPSVDVAEGAVRAACAMMQGRLTGHALFHCAAAGEASWADFAVAIFEHERALGHPSPRIVPITTAEYPVAASRPANSRLDSSAFEDTVGWRPQTWREGLSRTYSRFQTMLD